MVKRTKAQKKRMVLSIERKAWELVGDRVMSIKDYDSIVKVTVRVLNKIEK